METLRRILVFLLSILLLVLVGGGLAMYYTQGSLFGHITHQQNQNMNMQGNTNTQQPAQQTKPRSYTPQELAQIQAAFLNQYIDDINRAIGMINQANGLITSDSFFRDPPVVGKDASKDTPFDVPATNGTKTDKTTIVVPDNYSVYFQDDMRDVHRGIYRLAQGMTLLNQVLDRMNQDVGIIKRNPGYAPPLPPVGYNYSMVPGMLPYVQGSQYMYPAQTPQTMTGGNIGTDTTMTGGSMPSGHTMGTTGNSLNTGVLTNGLYLVIIVFFFLGFFAIGGFVLSLFKRKEPRVDEH